MVWYGNHKKYDGTNPEFIKMKLEKGSKLINVTKANVHKTQPLRLSER